ncbi:MAG: UDP-N-acetylmuramoyl-tripeptide--D-alanyl-D-alanine ligase [Gallionellaceae bacterium]|nr:UDP-N-acetylmuramoyl-tripeptide--D-alanyl-D-alanine ligase [Gallionellaceae bacterium]
MMLLSQAAEVLHGRLNGPDVHFGAVSTDTRTIAKGDLFVALRGENFDGARFVPEALKAGAAAAMVNAASHAGGDSALSTRHSILLVEDTRLALGQLAAYWRAQFDIPLVAITGSNGKTTVKEMLAGILREAGGGEESVLATRGNFNNDIGMPLTLLRMNAGHRYAVIEMGMNHPGEFEYLARLANPDVALINNATGAHLQGLGTLEGVARAKSEIFAGLKGDGTAIINADDAHAGLWRTQAGEHRVFDFSIERAATVRGEWKAQGYGGELRLRTPAGEARAALQVPGEHNARNALAAATAALALQVPLTTIAKGLEGFDGVAGRLQRKQALHGATLIDDTYNANPASVHAALEVLAQAQGKRIFVLGDMGELGDEAAQFHREIGIAARELGIEKLFALGALSAGAVLEFGSEARHFGHIEELDATLDKEMDAQTTVLVKGSRFMKMERVVQFCALQKEEACCSH